MGSAEILTYISGCLRDVPTPRETESECEGPAVWIIWRALIFEAIGGNACSKPGKFLRYLLRTVNRERELGLDRRETG